MRNHISTAHAEEAALVFVDGSCVGNPGPGGWAFRIEAPDGTVSERSGHDVDTTNNRMELQAVIQALETSGPDQAISVLSDSAYIIDGCIDYLPKWKANGWAKADGKPLKNLDDWKALDALIGAGNVTFAKVRGHTGNAGNERVDALARAAARNRVHP
jgi:ribonuclease HI